MYPKIFNFIDSYSLLIIIGLIVAFTFFVIYLKKRLKDKQYYYSLLIVILIAIILGFLGALFTQQVIDWISNNNRHFALTFYGGLLFGVGSFFLLFFLWLKKKYQEASIYELFIIAPGCIAIGHAFGRIGCFLSGCCYGIETDSWLGVTFTGHDHACYPTQLFEAIFLFVLAGILLFLAFKWHIKYNFCIYLLSYGIWRFLIEFIRGDDRGSYLLSLSPAQWFSIVAFASGIVLLVLLIHNRNKNIVSA